MSAVKKNPKSVAPPLIAPPAAIANSASTLPNSNSSAAYIIEIRSDPVTKTLVLVLSDGTTQKSPFPDSLADAILSSDDPVGALIANQRMLSFR